MSDGRLSSVGTEGLLSLVGDRVHDSRPLVATGWHDVDLLLHRQGMWPGTLCLLGGRTHTRKTTVMLNLAANMLTSGVRVGLVGLDETPASYGVKLLSALTGVPHEQLELEWETGGVKAQRHALVVSTDKLLSATVGSRPGFDDLSSWLEQEERIERRPQVVFIDYTSLLARNKYDGGELQRVTRMMEDLRVWAGKEGVVVIALHQVGRMSGAGEGRHHGALPLALDSLKFGGEEAADLVFGTYRPALDPLGNMSAEEAKALLGEKYDYEEHEAAKARVTRHREHTFLQLLKNRPGTKLHLAGLVLVQKDESMRMHPQTELVSPHMEMAE